MRLSLGMIALIANLGGCGSAPAECGKAECAAVCEAAAPAAPAAPVAEAAKVSSFEAGLVDPILKDVRAGVRPFGEDSIGICKGVKQCDEFLGNNAGELGEGRYMVRAELGVPNVGDPGTWKITFDLECTTTRKTANGDQTSTSNYSREYDVRYAGKDRGYRLQPLRTIESPSKGGARSCKYKITAPHPDGDKVYDGSWSTPEAS
jgi:hypothetical protein